MHLPFHWPLFLCDSFTFQLGPFFVCVLETLIIILFSADLLVMNSLSFSLSEYFFKLPSFLKSIFKENFMLEVFFFHPFRVFITFYFHILCYFSEICCSFFCCSLIGNDFSSLWLRYFYF